MLKRKSDTGILVTSAQVGRNPGWRDTLSGRDLIIDWAAAAAAIY